MEIGPGMGCLTLELSKRAARVVAVELDRALLPVMAETLTGIENVEVVQGDILKTDISALCAENLTEWRYMPAQIFRTTSQALLFRR